MKKTTGLLLTILFGVLLLSQNVRASWTTQRLTWSSGESLYPAIAADSNNHLHVVWQDDTHGNNEIFYKKSTDKGISWTSQRLTWNSGESYYPAIAVGFNNWLHLVWRDNTSGSYEVYYKRSTNGGTSWTTQRLTWSPGGSNYLTIAADSNNHLHVVWGGSKYEIYYKKSTNGGDSWMNTQRLTWNAGGSYVPCITADSSNYIHIVWCDNSSDDYEIYYKRSTNGGTSWTTQRLTWTSGESWYPDICVDTNNHLHVVWEDYTGGAEIYYKKSTDGGGSWTIQRLTWNSGGSWRSRIASDFSNHLHVVWQDRTPGNDEIFYKKSTNGGTSWTATQRLTWTDGHSKEPAIAADSSNHLHIVYQDVNSGNYEIYYKKN